ncbi:MAG: GGDEF domain-containing protein [Polynucleobacter sp.]|nr:MAG: GGDEF domain-containing protein [Polynucleobacter sp.]
MKFFVIALYLMAILLQLVGVYYAVQVLKKVKSYAYSIFFLILSLLIILIERFYYLIDCCLFGNYKLSQAFLYLTISSCMLIGVIGLRRLLDTLEDQNEKLQRVAKTDHLTGALSRLELESLIVQEIKRSSRTQDSIAILMMDIDHFKNVNDNYGHPIGDQVLKKLSHFCTTQLRSIDAFGRVGGEEFLMMLPRTSEAEAFQVAERIREGVAKLDCAKVDGQAIRIQVSLGISIYTPDPSALDNPYQLMKTHARRADLAMYQAKQAGRNQTRCWHE